MTREREAEIILDELDRMMQIDWGLKRIYIRAIIRGLDRIDNARRAAKVKQNERHISGDK